MFNHRSTLLWSGEKECVRRTMRVPGCQSFRLQVDSPTSRSFRLHDQVVSPTRPESIRLHESRFAYTYKSKCFVKMGEHHCLQLAEESYLTVFPVKFLHITTIMFAGINMFWARLILRLVISLRRAQNIFIPEHKLYRANFCSYRKKTR